MVTLEYIPPSLCHGLIIPVYKGKGRDPFNSNSYRGITLTSIIAKIFETILLRRMLPTLHESNFPHFSQTAYLSGRSCADALFVTNETLHSFMCNGDSPYLCLYDLEKAFDSIEYVHLLRHLFQLGVNGKAWRLIKFWYLHSSASIRSKGLISDSFQVHRGVKQGSVLSPILFAIVMDDLLKDLNNDPSCLSIRGLHVGSAAHADDVRTCNISRDSIQAQASVIHDFTARSSLRLNSSKTEIVRMSSHPLPPEDIIIHNSTVTVKKKAKCLGVWWTQNLSSDVSISENINKARRAFFALGSIGAYQGSLNPLTASSLFSTYVLPILLFGCEVWYVTTSLNDLLNQFQAEIGKRILRLPRSHSNIATRLALHWPSLKVLILCRKLSFLAHLLTSDSGCQSVRLLRTLSDNAYNISLIQQCRDLEADYGTDFLHQCLLHPDDAPSIVKDAKRTLLPLDWDLTCQAANSHPSLSCVLSYQLEDEWCNVWNCALDYGPRGTKLAQTTYKLLTKPVFGDKICSYCSITIQQQSFTAHLSTDHGLDVDAICRAIKSDPHSLFLSPLCDAIRQF